MMALTPQLHVILGALLRDQLGLHYGIEDRELLEGKLVARAVDAGYDSLLDYYYHLRYDDDGAELVALADALVVNESYFFREYEQLAQIVGAVVPRAIERTGRARIWSAACASGEEPLSLAMMLDRRGLLGATEIVASDLSSRALARAHSGTWTRRAVRVDPDPELIARYLQVEERAVRIAAPMIDAVDWRRLNLLDRDAVRALGHFDVILCRNVLIYFDDDTVRRVVTTLADQLVEGGLLFVGVSESLLRMSTALICEEHGGVFCYRRPS